MIAGWAFSVSVSSVSEPSRQMLPERRIDLLEHRPRGGAGGGKRLAHPGRLAALPRKDECSRQRWLLLADERVRLGVRAQAGKSHGISICAGRTIG
jgi:hypothetical protein